MQILELPKKITFNWKKISLIFSYSLLTILLIVSFALGISVPTQPYAFSDFNGYAGYYVISNHDGIKESYLSNVAIALLFFIILFLVQSIVLTIWYFFDKIMWFHNMYKITLMNVLWLVVGFIMVMSDDCYFLSSLCSV